MSNQPDRGPRQAGDPAGPAPGPGLGRPGPVGSVPPPAPVYGPVPTHYSDPDRRLQAAPPSRTDPPPGQPAASGYGAPHLDMRCRCAPTTPAWGKRVVATLID